jgi:hypothetical protein
VYTDIYSDQVKLINAAIDRAKLGSSLHVLWHVADPNLPDKTGEKGKWNFEKAHSILHKVREIILWGNSDNTSCQGPEVCSDISIHIQLSITMYLHVPSIYTFLYVNTKYIQVYT